MPAGSPRPPKRLPATLALAGLLLLFTLTLVLVGLRELLRCQVCVRVHV